MVQFPEGVRATKAVEVVRAARRASSTTAKQIGATFAVEKVVGPSATNDVVAALPMEFIWTRLTRNPIRPSGTPDLVRVIATEEIVLELRVILQRSIDVVVAAESIGPRDKSPRGWVLHRVRVVL